LFNFFFPSTKLNVKPLGEDIISMRLATSKIIGVSKEGKTKNFPTSNIRQLMSGVAKKIWNQTLETWLLLLLAKEEICRNKLGESRNKP
jgi:hypothetical protein